MEVDPGKAIFPGLYGEVVTCDVYGMREYAESHPAPDTVFDIGANIGIFARFARSLWPEAWVVGLEPHGENYDLLASGVMDGDDRTVLIHAAIGAGAVWRSPQPLNGAHVSYISEMPGYTDDWLRNRCKLEPVEVRTTTLASLYAVYGHADLPFVVKIDCEGAENAIFADAASMDVLSRSGYFGIEIHSHAQHGGEPLDAVRELLSQTLERLSLTHDLVVEGPIWKGTQKSKPEPTSESSSKSEG